MQYKQIHNQYSPKTECPHLIILHIMRCKDTKNIKTFLES